MRLQRTLRQEVTFEGVGLHTGRFAKVCLKPAPRDTGIIFTKEDQDIAVRASLGSVTDTAFATTLGLNGTKVKTV